MWFLKFASIVYAILHAVIYIDNIINPDEYVTKGIDEHTVVKGGLIGFIFSVLTTVTLFII